MFHAMPVLGASSDWFKYDQGSIRLISSTTTVGKAASIELGLQFQLKPGWKIYWRSPGDAGLPPKLNWEGSTNVLSMKMHWPVPERFSVLNLETLGYKHEVIFPIDVFLKKIGEKVAINGQINFLTCKEVCIPYNTRLTFLLPAGPENTSRGKRLIDVWKERVPKRGNGSFLKIDKLELVGKGEKQFLALKLSSLEKLKNFDVLVEGPEGYEFGRPFVDKHFGIRQLLIKIPIISSEVTNLGLNKKNLTLTLVNGDQAVERSLKISKRVKNPDEITRPNTPMFTLFIILGTALLGGLILNLMPCVLPVISLKLLTIINNHDKPKETIRRGFLASAVGIVFCFFLLANITITLQFLGFAAGWGLQFQQPAFIAFMLIVLTLLTFNVLGFFEIRLPNVLSGTFRLRAENSDLGKDFFMGVFATLLATPCTAPFLGSSVGFALSRGPFEIYVIFISLGLGLAFPWFAVAIFPKLVLFLPKPGHWMVTLKKILSIALLGTSVWLFTIMWKQVGYGGTVMIALLVGGIAFSLFHHPNIKSNFRFGTWVIVIFLSVVSIFGASTMEIKENDEAHNRTDKIWKPFDVLKIENEVSEGKTVFVDITADWCLTCQINKSFVLNRNEVVEIFKSGAVTAMRADWTKPNTEITKYLANHQKFGIPFNAVYGPNALDGIKLPEILTQSNVIEAIKAASGP